MSYAPMAVRGKREGRSLESSIVSLNGVFSFHERKASLAARECIE